MDATSAIDSIPELAFLTQLFVLGSAAGMAAAIFEYHRTGELDRWPLFVGYGALALLAAGGGVLVAKALL